MEMENEFTRDTRSRIPYPINMPYRNVLLLVTNVAIMAQRHTNADVITGSTRLDYDSDENRALAYVKMEQLGWISSADASRRCKTRMGREAFDSRLMCSSEERKKNALPVSGLVHDFRTETF